MKYRILCHFSLLIAVFFTSCIPLKRLEYFHDPVETVNKYNLQEVEEIKIKPNDEIYITVSSIDDPMFNFLGRQSEYTRSGYSNELSVSLISYTVQSDGTIAYPILGKIHIAGLTLEEARKQLEEKLQAYLNQPSVLIKFSYKKITVLGEVNQPGYHTYSKNKITLFEALGLANDVTIHGDREKVYVVRSEGDEVAKYMIDLTSDDILSSEFYYVQPHDIVYVPPRRSLRWDPISTPISLILTTISTTISTTILILNFIN